MSIDMYGIRSDRPRIRGGHSNTESRHETLSNGIVCLPQAPRSLLRYLSVDERWQTGGVVSLTSQPINT